MLGTELVLVRHGEAHCNVAGIAGGDRGCSGLTDRGYEQARWAAGHLHWMHHERPFQVVYAAPRRRVRETAAVICPALGLSTRLEPRLSGPHHGDADGLPWTTIWQTFGGSPADQPDRPFAPGAETWNQFLARATSCVRELLARHDGQRVLVVAHAETVEAAHTLLMRLPAGSSRWLGFTVAHASVTCWAHRRPETGPARWTLLAHNATSHLDRPADTAPAPIPTPGGPRT